jgi:hypothetical protein
VSLLIPPPAFRLSLCQPSPNFHDLGLESQSEHPASANGFLSLPKFEYGEVPTSPFSVAAGDFEKENDDDPTNENGHLNVHPDLSESLDEKKVRNTEITILSPTRRDKTPSSEYQLSNIVSTLYQTRLYRTVTADVGAEVDIDEIGTRRLAASPISTASSHFTPLPSTFLNRLTFLFPRCFFSFISLAAVTTIIDVSTVKFRIYYNVRCS